MKAIEKILNTVGKLYADLFDGIFNIYPVSRTSVLQEMYCSESYYITSGGIITKIED